MTITETTDDEIITSDEDREEFSRRFDAFRHAQKDHSRNTAEFWWDFVAGTALRGRHGPLYSIKDEEFCPCWFGADCGQCGFPGCLRTDVDGPYTDWADAALYYDVDVEDIGSFLVNRWVKKGRPRRAH